MLYLSRMRLRSKGPDRILASEAVGKLLTDIKGLITTLLIGNEFVNVAFSSVMASVFVLALGKRVGTPTSFALSLGLLILFGELVPKSLALRYPEDFALAAVHPLRFFYLALKPIRIAVQSIAGLILPVSDRAEGDDAAAISDEEFESLIEHGLDEGIYRKDEAELMRRILLLRNLTAKELMTPRTEVLAMPQDTTLSEAVTALKSNYFSRIPVYEDSIDKIKGVVLAKDLLKAARTKMKSREIKRFLREVPLVPETKRANKLLASLVAEHAHLAVVIDEYGGTEGIVTLEDVLEEIVGEIVDEKDEKIQEVIRIAPNTFEVLGSTRLDLFAEKVGCQLPEGDYDTVAGFIIARLGTIPDGGERVDEGRLHLEILRTEKSRIVAIRVEVNKTPAEVKGKLQ